MKGRALRFVLLAEGGADRVLIPIVEWLLAQKIANNPFDIVMAQGLPPKSDGLEAQISYVHAMYACDVLFVHRDSDNMPRESKLAEISAACQNVNLQSFVPVIPVRMTEAWLLFDEQVIRRASGNPNGKIILKLPPWSKWESLTDPKEILFGLLRSASELTGRKLAKFGVDEARNRMSGLFSEFRTLRRLPSFLAFEQELDKVLAGLSITTSGSTSGFYK